MGWPPNNGMQLTSGGFERASRAASFMRRLQLIPGRTETPIEFSRPHPVAPDSM
jgi:hypothetical protein